MRTPKFLSGLIGALLLATSLTPNAFAFSVTSISPSSGAAGATAIPVVVSGMDFATGLTVYISSSDPCSFGTCAIPGSPITTINSPGVSCATGTPPLSCSMEITMPAQSSIGTVYVLVVNGGGALPSSALTFNYTATTASATGTVSLAQGGTLSIGAVGPLAFCGTGGTFGTCPQLTLTGVEQFVTGNNQVTVLNNSGNTNGWHIDLMATDFLDGTTPLGGGTTTGLLSVQFGTSTGGEPLYNTVPVSGTPLNIYSTSTGSAGSTSATGNYRLRIPAAATAGTYSSTLTYTVVSGP